jgi:hypothetical protein
VVATSGDAPCGTKPHTSSRGRSKRGAANDDDDEGDANDEAVADDGDDGDDGDKDDDGDGDSDGDGGDDDPGAAPVSATATSAWIGRSTSKPPRRAMTSIAQRRVVDEDARVLVVYRAAPGSGKATNAGLDAVTAGHRARPTRCSSS